MVTTRKMNHYWNLRIFFTCLAFYVKESFEIQVKSFESGDMNMDNLKSCPPDACPDDCPTINYVDENACKRCKCDDWNVPCPDQYLQLGEGKQCIMISIKGSRRKWGEAQSTCVSKGGHLFHAKEPEVFNNFLTSWSVEENFWLGADELEEQEGCPSGYTEIGGQCFQFSEGRANWYEAKSMCEDESAHLASLEDPWPLREYVMQYFHIRSFWLGARYEGIPEPSWKWVSGAPFNASFPWGINDGGEQQYKGDRQECMVLRYFPDKEEHEYVDNKCKKMKRYICQKRKVTLEDWRWTSGEKVSDSFPWGINDRVQQQYKGEKQKCMVARYFPDQKIHQYVDNMCYHRYRFICEADRCPKGYTLVGAHSTAQCLKVSTEELTWKEATKDCDRKISGYEDWNYHLVIVKDATQFWNLITGLNSTENNYWVGAHNRGPKGGWRWLSGANLNPYFPWWENDGKGEEQRCVSLRFFKTPAEYQYVTNKCLNKSHYVCEVTRTDWTDSGEDGNRR